MSLAKGIQRHLKITRTWIMTLNVELCTAANFENAFNEKLLFILIKNVQTLRLKDKILFGLFCFIPFQHLQKLFLPFAVPNLGGFYEQETSSYSIYTNDGWQCRLNSIFNLLNSFKFNKFICYIYHYLMQIYIENHFRVLLAFLLIKLSVFFVTTARIVLDLFGR